MSIDNEPGIRFIRASELPEEWQKQEALRRNSNAGQVTNRKPATEDASFNPTKVDLHGKE